MIRCYSQPSALALLPSSSRRLLPRSTPASPIRSRPPRRPNRASRTGAPASLTSAQSPTARHSTPRLSPAPCLLWPIKAAARSSCRRASGSPARSQGAQPRLRLRLEAGAVIQFSRDYSLYPMRIFDAHGEKSVDTTSPLSGNQLEDIAITGAGVIDGGGDAWRPVKKNKVTETLQAARLFRRQALNCQGRRVVPQPGRLRRRGRGAGVGEKRVAPPGRL